MLNPNDQKKKKVKKRGTQINGMKTQKDERYIRNYIKYKDSN